MLVFVPGFLASARSYRDFLTEMAGDAITVVAPRLHRPGILALRGRPTPRDEAARAVALVGEIRSAHQPDALWIGGHSRGGQVAWLAADRLAAAGAGCDGIVVVDPVDGSGSRRPEPRATSTVAGFDAPTLIIGAGTGARCAPPGRNHAAFAACAPPGVEYVVVPTLGHADILTGAPARLGRILCTSGPDPAQARSTVARHIARFIAADRR